MTMTEATTATTRAPAGRLVVLGLGQRVDETFLRHNGDRIGLDSKERTLCVANKATQTHFARFR